MAGIIFLVWYFTCGYVYWKVRTNNVMADSSSRAAINKILEFNKGFEDVVWYGAMIVMLIIWPVSLMMFLFNRITGRTRKNF